MSKFARFSCVLFAAIALAFAIEAFAFVFSNAVEMPSEDEWAWASTIIAYHSGTLTLADLWAQHNEHRLFFPTVVMLALDSFGYWSQRRECLFGVAVVAGSLWLFWRTARATLAIRSALALCAIGSCFLFSPAQSQNWLWGFQIAWFMIDCTVFGAALLLCCQEMTGPTFAALAILAVVASFSSAFGLALLPAVCLGMIVRRTRIGWTPARAWIAVSLAIAASYLWGWHAVPGPNEPRLSFLAGVFGRALHAAIVAGLPVGAAGGAAGSAVAGALAVFAAAIAIARAVRCTDSSLGLRLAPWIVLICYGVVSSAMIGYGRAVLGPGQALASRYVTCSLVLWLGLLGFAAVSVRWSGVAPVGRAAWIAIGSVFASCVFATSFVGATSLSQEAVKFRNASAVFANFRRARDSDLTEIYPDPKLVRSFASQLASIGQLPEVRATP